MGKRDNNIHHSADHLTNHHIKSLNDVEHNDFIRVVLLHNHYVEDNDFIRVVLLHNHFFILVFVLYVVGFVDVIYNKHHYYELSGDHTK
jgi:TRAP-type mannitol/chloroaromatic compound transport system permease small subunit